MYPEEKPKQNLPENRPNASMPKTKLDAILTATRDRVASLRTQARELERRAAAAPEPRPFARALAGRDVGGRDPGGPRSGGARAGLHPGRGRGNLRSDRRAALRRLARGSGPGGERGPGAGAAQGLHPGRAAAV